MTTLKAYTLGNHGFIDQATRDAIGAKPWTIQGNVIIVAKSKAEAHRVYELESGKPASYNDKEFRQLGLGYALAQSLIAYSATTPAVYVTKWAAPAGYPVVRLKGGKPVRIGELVDADLGYGQLLKADT